MVVAGIRTRRQAIDMRSEGGESRDRTQASIADDERLGGEFARQQDGG
jgi:hypothetical protein